MPRTERRQYQLSNVCMMKLTLYNHEVDIRELRWQLKNCNNKIRLHIGIRVVMNVDNAEVHKTSFTHVSDKDNLEHGIDRPSAPLEIHVLEAELDTIKYIIQVREQRTEDNYSLDT